ncbi:hypothetical protein FACS1894110_25200 [Spirochaetia bacterium]|nr:hypothetical protein FACS1894110_25200 [Spirochaetia bacterium]
MAYNHSPGEVLGMSYSTLRYIIKEWVPEWRKWDDANKPKGK